MNNLTPEYWTTLLFQVIGIAIVCMGAFWRLNTAFSAKISGLHTKIEAMKDNIKDNYVRRDDLKDDIQRLERGQENLAAKMDNVTSTLASANAEMAKTMVMMRGN